MRFYYFSLFSWLFVGIVWVVAIGAFWVVWTMVLKRKYSYRVFWVSTAVIFVLPWTEELWIAWQFGQLCRKDAGVFVNRTVEVEGFYDSTMRSAYENTKPGRYRFVEHATEDRKGIERVERANDASRDQALAWYRDRNPGKGLPKDTSVILPLNEKEQIVVFPNGVDAWRVTTLNRPTARHHFETDSGKRAGYKIVKQQSVVLDSQSSEVLGRYARYSRDAPWLYIGLGRPPYACDGPDGGPNTKHSFLIYREILKPSK